MPNFVSRIIFSMSRLSSFYKNFKKFIVDIFQHTLEKDEIHSGILIIIYALLLCLGFWLFVQWSHVTTRNIIIRAEALKGVNRVELYINADGTPIDTIDKTAKVDIFFRIPMTLQKDVGRDSGSILWTVTEIEDPDSIIIHTTTTLNGKILNPVINNDSLCAIALKSPYIKDEFKKKLIYFSIEQRSNEFISQHLLGDLGDSIIQYPEDEHFNVFVKRKLEPLKYEWFSGFNSDKYSIGNSAFGGFFSAPGWFNLCDLSQCYYNIQILTKSIKDITFTLDFVSAANFSIIRPEPDDKTMSSITYTDKEKINKFKQEGVKFHVTFNEMQNKQAIRSFALTGVMSLLIGLLIKELVFLCYNAAKRRRRSE